MKTKSEAESTRPRAKVHSQGASRPSFEKTWRKRAAAGSVRKGRHGNLKFATIAARSGSTHTIRILLMPEHRHQPKHSDAQDADILAEILTHWRHSRIFEGKNKMRLFDDVTIYNQTSEMNNTPRIVHSNKPPVLSITQISLFRIYQSRLIFCYVPPVYPSRKSPRSLINRDDRRPPDADTSRDRSIARRKRRLIMMTSVRMLAGLSNRHSLRLCVVTACGVGAHMRGFCVGYWRDRC